MFTNHPLTNSFLSLPSTSLLKSTKIDFLVTKGKHLAVRLEHILSFPPTSSSFLPPFLPPSFLL
jgi:hypothetical protein